MIWSSSPYFPKWSHVNVLGQGLTCQGLGVAVAREGDDVARRSKLILTCRVGVQLHVAVVHAPHHIGVGGVRRNECSGERHGLIVGF